MKCLNCKTIEAVRKFCSQKCCREYQRKNKIGWYSDTTRKLAIRHGNEACKLKRRGFYDKSVSKLGNDTQKILKTGFYNSELQRQNGAKGIEVLRKNKLGYFNAEVRIRAGLAGIRAARKNIRSCISHNHFFDSSREAEIALCLKNQFGLKFKENKTIHVQIGRYEYDFYLESFDCFIEYHPCTYGKESFDEYLKKRVANLKHNNYLNSTVNLITTW